MTDITRSTTHHMSSEGFQNVESEIESNLVLISKGGEISTILISLILTNSTRLKENSKKMTHSIFLKKQG